MAPQVTTVPDSDLVSRVQQGDPAAESNLYQKYSERILFLALSELRSRPDAEDVRAETFLRVILALREGRLRKPDSLPSFLVGIALNVIREHTRQRAGHESLTDLEAEIAGTGSPESVFLDEEVAQSIAATARHLKPREREFLRLYYYEELSKDEIARVLGIKAERLRLIKSRALKRFREIYERSNIDT
jgi:RNA polymerase sigma-70 factor (ECF subfamily)